ncbi:MAG TPA: thiopeptide-type bacteriocin biosynthesis protein, partial [Nonomuraea sp.]|nr:thiopeptide-type bacteriocin biosynthesis protein [Nonomuraea sp.]
PDRVVELHDILVGATDERLYLWSRRLGRELVVTQHHMLTPAAAPNVSRFLLEVSHDGYTPAMGFRWGVLEGAPFLPRVRRGKVVLRPAQWTVRELGEGWREQWRVPRHVFLTEDDHRLLLDLDQPVALDTLRREIAAKGAAVLEEMLPGFDGLWLRDDRGLAHTAEIVVPLVAAEPPRRRVAPARAEVAAPRFPPGSEWSFLKVYAAPERHDEIIAGPLRELVAELRAAGLIDRWFYLRYADPRPHLRVRCRGPAAELLPALAAWGEELAGRGMAADLQLATYEPELARYGGPRVFDAAERFFEANSDVTAELVARRLDLRPEHLAVAAVDTLCAQWGVPLLQRLDLVPGHHADDESHRRFREHRAYLCELLRPDDRRPHPRGRADRELLAAVLAPQRPAAEAVAAAVRAAASDLGETETMEAPGGETPRAEAGDGARRILGSLLHMQINRLMPIDLDRESRCYVLWRHTLRAIRGRLVAEGVS